ncbi:GAF domain-containing protein [Desertivirga arenae]|uniref:GAF domain-containing protein n=1 Tax=Desertivirga arenae TaxID=2810309 RepID=UPI001A975644|nr:GAF domain-containing protein [Pedobacter sp. SYSU D00823]
MSLVDIGGVENQFVNEHLRVAAAKRYLEQDIENLKNLEDVVAMVSKICDVPTAYVSLMDDINQILIAKKGIDVESVPLGQTFCVDTIQQDDLVIIPDASKHSKYQNSPFVTGEPHIRFYAGMPVKTHAGYNIGTLCIIDSNAKQLSTYQIESLKMLSTHVIYLLELRIALNLVNDQKKNMQSSEEMLREKYDAQNKQLQSLATVMSHQISGPVATMKGLMYLINTLPSEESKEYLPLMGLVLDQMDEAVKLVTANAFAAVEND